MQAAAAPTSPLAQIIEAIRDETQLTHERPLAPESGEVDAAGPGPREALILDKHRALLAALLAEVELGSVEPVRQVQVTAQTG